MTLEERVKYWKEEWEIFIRDIAFSHDENKNLSQNDIDTIFNKIMDNNDIWDTAADIVISYIDN